MTLTPEQWVLAVVIAVTALMWIPYTLALVMRGGLMAAMGNRDNVPALPAWAERAKRAHGNAVENLALFAPAVLVASQSTHGAQKVVDAAGIYLVVRLLHYVSYVLGVPGLRTLSFVAGWVATLALVIGVLF